MSGSRLAIGGHRGDRGRTQARPRRAPRSRRLMALAATAAVLGAGLLGWGGYWLLTAPNFAVERVETGPYRFCSGEQVDSVLRSVLDHNIWTLPAHELRADLEALPWVRTAHVRRRVPRTVVVELVEWRPLVSVALPTEGDHVLVADGRVLALPAHLTVPGLPVLVGAELTTESELGPSLGIDGTARIGRLLDELAATGFESTCPVDFIRITPQGLRLELAGRAGSVLVGREGFGDRLARYRLLDRTIEERHGAATSGTPTSSPSRRPGGRQAQLGTGRKGESDGKGDPHRRFGPRHHQHHRHRRGAEGIRGTASWWVSAPMPRAACDQRDFVDVNEGSLAVAPAHPQRCKTRPISTCADRLQRDRRWHRRPISRTTKGVVPMCQGGQGDPRS